MFVLFFNVIPTSLKSNSKIKMLKFTVRHSIISEQIKTNEVQKIRRTGET